MGRIRRRGAASSALAVTIGVAAAIGWMGAGSAAAQSCLSVNGIHIAGVVLSPTEDWITVDAYVPATKHQVKTKLQVANRVELARYAIEHGLDKE